MSDSTRPPFPTEVESIPPTRQAARQVPLPVQVRGTRYAVGAILLAIISTVVVMTYLRIEQQLQETLEGQLGAVLSENVHGVERWLDSRESLAQQAANLATVEAAAVALEKGETSEKETLARIGQALFPLVNTRVTTALALLPEGREKPLAALGPLPQRLPNLTEETGPTSWFEPSGAAGKVFNAARIGGEKGKAGWLIVGAPAEELVKGFAAAAARGAGETYAFTSQGIIGDKSHIAAGGPATALPSLPRTEVRKYVGPDGVPVVGAFTWIGRLQIGLATVVSGQEAYGYLSRLRQSFLVLVILVGACILGFIALGRWTLRIREESLLMTRRLGRLARAIQPLSAALEHDPSAVVLADAEGQVVYANAASHRVLGVQSSLFGQDIDAVFENLPSELQTALHSGTDSIMAKGTGADDETLLVSSRSLTIDGNPHALFMLRPVTQQVRRQEVEHWKKLIRVLSHELNNALAPITSLLSSARKVNQMSHQDPRLGEIFENIAERTAHLIKFIEGYREVARLPLPDQKEVGWKIFLSGLLSQKKFRVRGEIPSRPGYFDPSQLERVLINVLNNAVEADSPFEDVEVEVLDQGTGFCVNVLDRGTGMAEPVLKQAMLPFFSTKRTGTGVGLALSREIIEAHGGQLTLANREGGGLVVSCFLPNPELPKSRSSVARVAVSPRNPDETST